MSQPSRSLRLRHSMRTSVSVSLMIPAQTIASLNALWSGSPFTIGKALKLIVLSVFQNTVNVLFASLITGKIVSYLRLKVNTYFQLYSHSLHMNQSVSVHSSAASRVMCSSSLHPQQDTSTLLATCLIASRRLRRLKCRRISVIVIWFFIVFLSLTGNSLSEKAEKVNKKNNFSFFFFCYLCQQLARNLRGEWGIENLSHWLSMTYGRRAAPRRKSLSINDLRIKKKRDPRRSRGR